MMENKIVANNGSSIVLYTTDDGNTQLEVKFEKETSHPGRRISPRSHSNENTIIVKKQNYDKGLRTGNKRFLRQ